jgi:predicted Zn-dependent protease
MLIPRSARRQQWLQAIQRPPMTRLTCSTKSLVEDQNPRAYRLTAAALHYKTRQRPRSRRRSSPEPNSGGDLKKAQIFAKTRSNQISPGSPDWIKTDDIINYKPQT